MTLKATVSLALAVAQPGHAVVVARASMPIMNAEHAAKAAWLAKLDNPRWGPSAPAAQPTTQPSTLTQPSQVAQPNPVIHTTPAQPSPAMQSIPAMQSPPAAQPMPAMHSAHAVQPSPAPQHVWLSKLDAPGLTPSRPISQPPSSKAHESSNWARIRSEGAHVAPRNGAAHIAPRNGAARAAPAVVAPTADAPPVAAPAFTASSSHAPAAAAPPTVSGAVAKSPSELQSHVDHAVLELDSNLAQLRQYREEMGRAMAIEEEKRANIQNEIRALTEQLYVVDASLGRKRLNMAEYDKTIGETEAQYAKIKRNSQALLNSLNQQSVELTNRLKTLVTR